ncbi:MAG: MFS transporter, partial [Bacillota bacterium]|nr:MFS transporter [Bacillota bacterium]
MKKKNFVLILIVYLLGLFIGAIDTGIITPARPIIQSQLGVDANLGIWMITIYTLTYAAIIPISGKLADKRGRKPVYLLSIALFGTGSLICALSASADSFLVLMIGRVVQASGAGGIMPVATAEFGTSFPEEKRGMALGLVGAVYGIANVLGASVGSAVLDIAGAAQWQWIFLINLPICVFIVIAGIIVLPNNRAEETKPMDKIGTLLMTLIILALLYGLKNLDFFDFIPSFTSLKVWPFIAASALLIPLFVKVERKAEDPIFHIEYASNRQIMVTLILGVVVGCSMMGMIFIPQFSENCLKMVSGSGGYFVIVLGFCSGAASMMSGRLIDKRGAKPVMAAGFITTIIGCLYLSFVAVKFVNLPNVIISLVIIGFGLGLTMGTPLNYMMLQNTSDEESNSALATLSLVRSIGTAIAPAIMVGFIVHAAAGLQTGLMEALPQPEMPAIEQQTELKSIVEQLKEANADNPEMLEMLSGMDDMDYSSMSMDMSDMSGDGMELPDELLDGLQNADVTTIVGETKKLAEYMFDTMTADVVVDAQ